MAEDLSFTRWLGGLISTEGGPQPTVGAHDGPASGGDPRYRLRNAGTQLAEEQLLAKRT